MEIFQDFHFWQNGRWKTLCGRCPFRSEGFFLTCWGAGSGRTQLWALWESPVEGPLGQGHALLQRQPTGND